MSERGPREKVLAVSVTVVMVVSVLAGVVALSGTAAAAGNTTPSQLEVVNVQQTKSGNLAVTVEATSSESVTDLDFTYRDLPGGSTKGPIEFSNANAFVGANAGTEAEYVPGSPLTFSNTSANNGTITYTIDSAATGFSFVNSAFRVNVTSNDTAYAGADTGNRSVITANHYQVSGTDHTGSTLSGVPIMMFDPATNESGGFGFLQSGTKAVHCRGIDDGGTCTNPDTDSASSVVMNDFGRVQTSKAPVAFQTFALSQSNASKKVDPGSRGSVTLTADTPTAPVFVGWESVLQGNERPNVENITVTNTENGKTVYEDSGVSFETETPVFLRPNTRYNFSLENGGTFGTVDRSLVIPTKGTTRAAFQIETGSVATSTVAGQIVGESGNGVSDAVVVAQPERTDGNQVPVYNSTTTDSNGLFSMAVPETSQFPEQGLGFRVVGTDTSGGTPVYYPTTDANDGEGYTIQSSKTVLPPMVLQKGGRVDIDVTTPSGNLPVADAFSSLSQVSSAYPALARTANVNTFTTLAFGGQKAKTASVELLAPTTGSDTQVAYNVWGLGQAPGKYLCVKNVDVTQGKDTDSTCSLADGGYINLSVDQYGSIVQQGQSRPANTEDVGFFFENELVVRDDSSGEVIAYLGPDGAQQFFAGKDGVTTDVRIPVPAGKYTVELRPSEEFGRWTTVNDTAAVDVTSGSETDVTLDRGRPFEIRPLTSRFVRSLKRSGSNTLAVQVADPITENLLSDSELTVTAQLRNPDGTVATDPVELTYNATDSSFDTKTFDPKSLGVDAGTYDIAVTASHESGTRTYNNTISAPTQVTGIQTYIDFSSRSVAPGSNLLGLVKAYDGGTGVDTNANDVDISVYDSNGKQVKTANPSNGLTSGEGSFSVTMPDDPGRYRITAKVDTGSKQGIAQRVVRVSELELSVETDKDTYSPTDSVDVAVEATDATDGSAITDATVELRVNGTREVTSTDANGEATVSLDPNKFASGSWDRGHPVRVTLTQETDIGVVRKTSGTGFDVRSFDARAAPTSRSFTPSESAEMDVFVPTDKTISSVTVTRLDGERVSIGGGSVSNPAPGLYRVDLGQLAVGEHIATATVTTQSGATETAAAQVVVKSYEIAASLNKRTFTTTETVDLTVGVRKPDGTAVSNQRVDVSLNSTGPVREVDSASATTGSSGEASVSLSPSSGGGHFLEVSVGEQKRYLGLFVSDVSVRLEDSSGNDVDGYEAEPGTTKTLYIDASKSDGSDVPDGSGVTAYIDAFDDRIELGSATTTNGEASIDVDVPGSVPAREYGLAVRVTTTDGTGTTAGVMNVTGANAKQITAATNESGFGPGDTARLSATVTNGNGSPIANQNVDFVLQSDGSSETLVATASTNGDGVATHDYDIPSDASDGAYVLKTALTDAPSIRSYSGYRVRSFDVSVEAEDGPFAPGDSVSLTVSATDDSGNAVSATGGSLTLVLPGSNAEKELSLSGSAPYDVSVTVPDDADVTGTRTISATLEKDRTSDTDSTLVDVRDESESANLSIAEPLTAGQSTTVTVDGTVDRTATLTAFSPNAGTVAFNGSVGVSSSSDTTTSMTIDSPGDHIVKLSVPSVGTITEVVEVQPSSGNVSVWTGTGVSANATEFTTSEDVYLKSNQKGMTATVIGEDETYEVELDQQSGDTYYGTLSTDRPSGVYLVRLDSGDATGVDDTLVEVSD